MKIARMVVLATNLAFASIAGLFSFGCHPMDRVAWSIEGYGTVSISAPLLVPVEKAKGFAFDLDKDAEFYFSVDRVEGAIRLVQQRAFDVQFAMQVQVEELLSSLAELKQAKTTAQSEAVQKKLTRQALAVAALQQAAMGSAGADAISANPLLKVGLDFLAASVGIGTGGEQESDDQGNVAPEDAPDDAAPPATIEEAVTDAGSPDGDAPSVTPETDEADGGAGAGADEGDKPAFKSLLPLARPAKDVLTSPQFSAPLGQFAGPINISPRQALLLSANDKMTQDLFKWFAQPNGFGVNKKAYFCMLTVSCQPGYWTKKNFAADVLITTEYGKNCDCSEDPECCSPPKDQVRVEDLGGGSMGYTGSSTANPASGSGRPAFSDTFRRPLVAAVYPMVDSQVLDLRLSQREQLASALSLALTGFGAQAELLADYVERQEQDAQTRTAITVGSAYSAGGYNFGFRIEPRFVAIEDPGNLRGGAGNRLEPTQFPAMVLVFADKSDLSKEVGGSAKKGGYDQIVFHVESRWLPKDWITGLFYRQSERKMLRRARLLDEQLNRLSKSKDPNCNEKPRRSIFSPNLLSFGGMGDLEYATLKRRRWALSAAGLGSTIVMQLPKSANAKEPKVVCLDERKQPDVGCRGKEYFGWDNALSTFVVTGENFSDTTVKGAAVGGRACAVEVLGSQALIVACDAWGDKTLRREEPPVTTPPYEGDYETRLREGELVIATTFGAKPAGTVKFEHHYEMKRPKARPSVTLERDSAGNITGVKVTGDFYNAKALLEAIEEALKCCSDFDLKIDASGSVGVDASSKSNP